MTDRPVTFGIRLPRRFHFARHLAVFVAASALLLAAEILSGADWWLFWPLGVWATLVAVHYFIASAYEPDEAWIDERIADLRSRSYDFDHIRNIEQRIKERDDSVTPPTERDPSSPPRA